MLVDTLYILPTELGLPLVFHLEVPVYISVTGDVKFNVLQLSKNTPLNFPDTFQLTTNLKPMSVKEFFCQIQN